MTKDKLVKRIATLEAELRSNKAELEKLGVPARVMELRGIMDKCKTEFDSLSIELAQIGKRRNELNDAHTAARNELGKLEMNNAKS